LENSGLTWELRTAWHELPIIPVPPSELEPPMSNEKKPLLTCKFCHKTQEEVAVLLAFPENLQICDECVWLMVEIIATGRPDWRDRTIEKLRNVEPRIAQTHGRKS
jgi:hypothetical protein